MSSRALRKAQKDREAAAAAAIQEQEEESSEDERFPVAAGAPSAFALLGAESQESPDQEDKSDEEVKDASHQDSIPLDSVSIAQTSQPPANSKRNKKKKKKKDKGASANGSQKGNGGNIASSSAQDNLDDVDVALAALSAMDQQQALRLPGALQEELDASKLLSIDVNHLQVLNEVRRAFGKDFVEGDQQDRNDFLAAVRRRAQARAEVGLADLVTGLHSKDGEGLADVLIRRNIFVRGRKEWPKATATGLSMEIVHRDEAGITEYAFVHNQNYKNIQAEFMAAVHMGEPMALVQLLRLYPYHITTLIQVSTFAKYQGDGAVAGELLERALFSFGRALHTSFAAAIAQGKARLDFRRPENREFFLTARRYLSNLDQRGTRRTEYEWAKLLLSLDPENDPACMRLCIDRLAFRCHQQHHFRELVDSAYFFSKWEQFPNILYSRALALASQSPPDPQSGNRLDFATQRFPEVLRRLATTLDIPWPDSKDWKAIANTSTEPQRDLLAEIYTHESLELWKADHAVSLLNSYLKRPAGARLYPQTDFLSAQSLRDISRYCILSEDRTLIAQVPLEFKSDPGDEFDPLPPTDSFPMYNLDTHRPSHQPAGPSGPGADDRPAHEIRLSFSDPLMRYQEIPGPVLRNLFPRAFIAEVARLQDYLASVFPADDAAAPTPTGQTYPPERIAAPIPGTFDADDDADDDASVAYLLPRLPALQLSHSQLPSGPGFDFATFDRRQRRFTTLLRELHAAPGNTITDVLGSRARLLPGLNYVVVVWMDVEGGETRTAGTLDAVLDRDGVDGGFADVDGGRWRRRWGLGGEEAEEEAVE